MWRSNSPVSNWGTQRYNIVKMLRPDGDYTQELLGRIVQITGYSDMTKIRTVMDRHRHALQARMETINEQLMRQKYQEEKQKTRETQTQQMSAFYSDV